ncbi:MAG: flagellar export chaperone FliS [Oceanospirillaceae bacterium]|nr:flagellar export chaperone FliS [Oceanospirillaceae bacterium]
MVGVQAYRSVDLGASAQTASPHQLISMLLTGALEAIAKAKGAIERKDIEARTMQINKASSIVVELKECLDVKAGGELAQNLESLYSYITVTLMHANRENSIDRLNEAAKLIGEVLDGWSQIPPEMRGQKD